MSQGAFRRPPKHVPVLVEASLERFGKRLRIARKLRSLTLEQLAALSDVSIATIRSLEDGGDGVSLGNFLKVMKGLDLLDHFETVLDPKADPEVVSFAQRALGGR